MSWSSGDLSQQRWKLVLAVNSGLSVQEAARRWSTSRKSVYKWLERYQRWGCAGLADRPRTRRHQICLRNEELRGLLLRLKGRYPTWGARKLLPLLPTKLCSLRTLERALADAGLTTRRKRRSLPGPQRLRPSHLSVAQRPNDVWTVDFKGWFRTADGQRCDFLTVRDLYSRFGLGVCLVPRPNESHARKVFIRLFRRFGLPRVIRVDNGPPFARTGTGSPYGWSTLSLWWSRLGIDVQMTRPAKPQDNGAHEQFHAVYQAEVVFPLSANPKAQQRRSQRWLQTYNFLRPHQALGGRVPSSLYRLSRRRYRSLPHRPRYPATWIQARVSAKGLIRFQNRSRLLSRILAGLLIGLHPIAPGLWHVYIDRILLGSLHQEDPLGMRPASYRPLKKLSPI